MNISNINDSGLQFKPRQENYLSIRLYSDADFASNDYLSSQIRYIIPLCDEESMCHVIDYRSNNSKTIVRFIMRSEVYASSDSFDK